MSNIGFDFGTTNSVISFYDRERQALDCFRSHAGGNSYIPTVVAYGGRTTKIGEAAKAELGSPDVYADFKLRLGSGFEDPMPGQTRTPHEVAGDYISTLLQEFREAGHTVQNIVMTIPEAWYGENSNFMARENLQLLYQEIGETQVCFQSEPVAAAAYYCWRYQYQQEDNPDQKGFDGTLMIIDFGGGTLDVTLCRVDQGQKIRVLDSCGSGEGIENRACGGSAFDEEVIKLLCREYRIELFPALLALAKNEFEQKLIAKAGECTEIMQDYFEYPAGLEDEQILVLNSLGGRSVCCRHLKTAFDKVNRPILERAVKTILKKNKIPSERFNVVMVGGFSNFCCVENAPRQLLDSRTGADDPPFTKLLSQENKALAVAKGAALIADSIISVDPVFPYELGVVMGVPDEELHYHDIFVPLIRKGDLRDDYYNPLYSRDKVTVLPGGVSECYVRLYAGIGEERTVFALDESVKEIFPEYSGKAEYEIGIAVTENMIPELCIRSSSGTESRTQLNKLLERIVFRKG